MSSIASGTTSTTALVYTADTTGNLVLQTNGTTTALSISTAQAVSITAAASTAPLTLSIGGTTTTTFDGNGNLGLGVTPSAWSQGKAFEDGASGHGLWYTGSVTDIRMMSNVYYNSGYKFGANGLASYLSLGNGGFQVQVSTTSNSGGPGAACTLTQAMTLDNSGNLIVGATAYSGQNANYFAVNTSNGNVITGHASGTPSGYQYAVYLYNGSAIGSITQSGTTAVLYNTTSDYRLKSNVQPVTSGLSVINQLNPVNFTWISDNEADTGFLAHEFQSVIPRAVTGAKDAVDTDGKPVYQQMDNSGAVPYLVAAIKELSAQVTTLQSQVAALTPKA